MNSTDLKNMTDDDIADIDSLISAEKQRRKCEKKQPMYCFDGKAMKSLSDALIDVESSTNNSLS